MSFRARENYYLTAGGALVTERDPAGRTLAVRKGDEIPSWAAEQFALAPYVEPSVTSVQCVGIHVRHSDATGLAKLTLPPCLLLDIFVICTEAAAPQLTRPDIDFGEKDGDTDGLCDGLGQTGICDTLISTIDGPNFLGRGELLTSVANEADLKTKVRKLYPFGMTFQNASNYAGGTSGAGEWTIYLTFAALPGVET